MKRTKIMLTTGETYPFEFTMGAMLIFRKETGREATEADFSSFSDLLTIMWAGTVAAAEVEGNPCKYTLQEFANRLNPDALTRWQKESMEAAGEEKGESKKKMRKKGVNPPES